MKIPSTKKKKEKPTKNLAGSKKIPPEVSNLARIGTPPRKRGEGGEIAKSSAKKKKEILPSMPRGEEMGRKREFLRKFFPLTGTKNSKSGQGEFCLQKIVNQNLIAVRGLGRKDRGQWDNSLQTGPRGERLLGGILERDWSSGGTLKRRGQPQERRQDK